MEDFEKKLSIGEPMAEDGSHGTSASDTSTTIVNLLRKFLAVQQRRAEAYSNLKRGFSEYMISGNELVYQQLCSDITLEFNNCSKQVIEMESLFQNSEYDRVDLAKLLRSVQEQEKQKLNLTVTLQVLKKAGRPSERLVSHADCKFEKPMEHECVHVHEITEEAGTEEAEADAMYDKELKEAIRGVQDAVTAINEHLEEVRYEIVALESE
ncbi:uncharacterized protein LOC133797665 [Humulus lupulus]|uniref:uncharacterized protein LOC133797665 n=1 Tax=Humulus lupulus TaxID=3486 RepID=UPI002B4158DE|nr:uncharacterized protein LOC133797665 [Humulus lupulus]